MHSSRPANKFGRRDRDEDEGGGLSGRRPPPDGGHTLTATDSFPLPPSPPPNMSVSPRPISPLSAALPDQ